MKITLIFLLIVLFSGTLYTFADEPIGQFEVDLYQVIQFQNKDFSEAEIQQAMGFGLLDYHNNWQRAAIHFQKATVLNPKLYKSWYTLGLIYISSDRGNGYFKKAIQENPGYSPPYYWLGYNYCKAGKDKEAITWFENYVKVVTKEAGFDDADRLKTATDILRELRSGKEGNELKLIHLRADTATEK